MGKPVRLSFAASAIALVLVTVDPSSSLAAANAGDVPSGTGNAGQAGLPNVGGQDGGKDGVDSKELAKQSDALKEECRLNDQKLKEAAEAVKECEEKHEAAEKVCGDEPFKTTQNNANAVAQDAGDVVASSAPSTAQANRIVGRGFNASAEIYNDFATKCAKPARECEDKCEKARAKVATLKVSSACREQSEKISQVRGRTMKRHKAQCAKFQDHKKTADDNSGGFKLARDDAETRAWMASANVGGDGLPGTRDDDIASFRQQAPISTQPYMSEDGTIHNARPDTHPDLYGVTTPVSSSPNTAPAETSIDRNPYHEEIPASRPDAPVASRSPAGGPSPSSSAPVGGKNTGDANARNQGNPSPTAQQQAQPASQAQASSTPFSSGSTDSMGTRELEKPSQNFSGETPIPSPREVVAAVAKRNSEKALASSSSSDDEITPIKISSSDSSANRPGGSLAGLSRGPASAGEATESDGKSASASSKSMEGGSSGGGGGGGRRARRSWWNAGSLDGLFGSKRQAGTANAAQAVDSRGRPIDLNAFVPRNARDVAGMMKAAGIGGAHTVMWNTVGGRYKQLESTFIPPDGK